MSKLFRKEADQHITPEIENIEKQENIIWEYERFPIYLRLNLDTILYAVDPTLPDKIKETLEKSYEEFRSDAQHDSILQRIGIIEEVKINIPSYSNEKEGCIITSLLIGMREDDWKVIWRGRTENDVHYVLNIVKKTIDKLLKSLTEEERFLITSLGSEAEIINGEHEWELDTAREDMWNIDVCISCANCDEEFRDSIEHDGIHYLFINNIGHGNIFDGECHPEEDEENEENEGHYNHEWEPSQAYSGGDYLEVEFECSRCEKIVETNIIFEKIKEYFSLSTEGCQYTHHNRYPLTITPSKELYNHIKKLTKEWKWKTFWGIDLPKFFKVTLPDFFKKIGRFFIGIWKWLKSCKSTIKKEM